MSVTEIYTLSLHDALPIYHLLAPGIQLFRGAVAPVGSPPLLQAPGKLAVKLQSLPLVIRAVIAPGAGPLVPVQDRKSTRLNSSHVKISYAVFCLKKKNM